MKRPEERRFEKLSPFELKDKLIKMARSHHERVMLNAGRGNPNWVATIPRSGFFQLGIFATEESLRVVDLPAIGGTPEKSGISKRFEAFFEKNAGAPGIDFLRNALAYVNSELKLDPDEFVLEMVDGILGDHYPEPSRMLTNCEKIVHNYLEQEMCGGNPPPGRYDLFATEGGTAAMHYIFTSLMENKLLHKGDKIAIGTPIFTPYIEIPRLNDHEFVELEIRQDQSEYWQYPDSEIEKLADHRVKAFFLVHPSNPTSVAMHPATLDRIGNLIKTKRRDLIVITDDVYGTFVNGFRSLAAVVPHNTILVYSYSKYFGATGWRLGVIGIHEDNIFDEKIAALSVKDKVELRERYGGTVLNPDKMRLIERIVADSRSVALHHTAGLSTPQQVLMSLFSLFCLLDKRGDYKKVAQYIVAHRFKTLYDAIGVTVPQNQYDAHYYTTIDIPSLARQRYGEEFADHLTGNYEPIDFVVQLADQKSIVLMDGGGFEAPNMSVRVSLANLANNRYEEIGKGISDLLAQYHHQWRSLKRK